MNEEKAIVILGNPVDGLSFIGPFDSENDAIEYCEMTIGTAGWLVTTISAP